MAETLLLAGTRKGLMLARKRAGSWETESLQLPMQAIYAVGIDTRGPAPRLFAGATSEHWGPTVLHSDDLGRSWKEPDHAPVAFPREDRAPRSPGSGRSSRGPCDQPGVVYAGTEPTALFRSEDGGRNFELNQRAVGPPAPPGVGARLRRPGAAHDRAVPGGAGPDAGGDVHRRRLPHRGRRPQLGPGELRHQVHLPARGGAVPGVRPVRAQGRARRGRPGASSTCRTTTASTAAATGARPGPRRRRACPPSSASPSPPTCASRAAPISSR